MKPIHNKYDSVESLKLFEGMTLKILLSSADTSGLQAVFEDIVEPGVGPSRHIHHKQDETFLFLEGNFGINYFIASNPIKTTNTVLENSKEGFRQALLNWVPDRNLLLDKHRMVERAAFAGSALLPQSMLMDVSETYLGIAAQIIGSSITVPENPRAEIKELLSVELGLV